MWSWKKLTSILLILIIPQRVVLVIFFLRQSLIWFRLPLNSVCSLNSDPPASVSGSAEITSRCYHACLLSHFCGLLSSTILFLPTDAHSLRMFPATWESRKSWQHLHKRQPSVLTAFLCWSSTGQALRCALSDQGQSWLFALNMWKKKKACEYCIHAWVRVWENTEEDPRLKSYVKECLFTGMRSQPPVQNGFDLGQGCAGPFKHN